MKTTSGRKRPPNTDEPPFAGGAELRCIETSGLIAAILEDDISSKQAIRGEGRRVTSALTFSEARRAVVRSAVAKRITVGEERSALLRLRRIQNRLEIVAISDEVLERAGRRFPVEPIRALDAIHLATAERLDASPRLVTLVTRDHRVAQNARAMGFVVE